jgi:hypothetical protein
MGLAWTPAVPTAAGAWRPYWALTLYPEAAEAGGSLRVPRRRDPRPGKGSSGRALDEAKRRARGKIRRYCVANRLNRLGTLTYAGMGCHDPASLRQDVATFFKAMRRAIRSTSLPYVWVPEWHGGGHGLHVHFAVGRFVKQSLIRDTWGRGHVHIKLLGDLPVGSGRLEEARLSARYLAKYVSKGVDDERDLGLHRYEVAQGFQPQAVRCDGRSMEEAIRRASNLMGRAPVHVWQSSSEEGWDAPPACWVAW